MDVLQKRASAELRGLDLDIVTGTIQIAKSSARLWAPAELGGTNYYAQYASRRRNERGGWKGAIYGDISGSASYFQGLGIGCALGWAPGGNVVILGGWAISAGIASAYAALNINMVRLPRKPENFTPLNTNFGEVVPQ